MRTYACQPSASGDTESGRPDDPELPLALSHPLRILVAEDNAANQLVARLFLEGLGYGEDSVDIVGDGRLALAACHRRRYDVVLMDVQMPEMDGLEATRGILAQVRDPPTIVAMTAHATEADRHACLAAGMSDYLSKPLRPERLRAALRRCRRPRRRSGAIEDSELDRGRLSALSESVGHDPAALRALVERLSAALAAELGRMAEAAAAGDAEALTESAALATEACAPLGARRVAQLTALCARWGQSNEAQRAAELVDRAQAALRRLDEAIAAELAR